MSPDLLDGRRSSSSDEVTVSREDLAAAVNNLAWSAPRGLPERLRAALEATGEVRTDA